jgi:hypothetical protein
LIPKKFEFFLSSKFFLSLVIKTLDPDQDRYQVFSLKCWIRIRISIRIKLIRIRNTGSGSGCFRIRLQNFFLPIKKRADQLIGTSTGVYCRHRSICLYIFMQCLSKTESYSYSYKHGCRSAIQFNMKHFDFEQILKY